MQGPITKEWFGRTEISTNYDRCACFPMWPLFLFPVRLFHPTNRLRAQYFVHKPRYSWGKGLVQPPNNRLIKRVHALLEIPTTPQLHQLICAIGLDESTVLVWGGRRQPTAATRGIEGSTTTASSPCFSAIQDHQLPHAKYRNPEKTS